MLIVAAIGIVAKEKVFFFAKELNVM